MKWKNGTKSAEFVINTTTIEEEKKLVYLATLNENSPNQLSYRR